LNARIRSWVEDRVVHTSPPPASIEASPISRKTVATLIEHAGPSSRAAADQLGHAHLDDHPRLLDRK
jgi:hypothetical protein